MLEMESHDFETIILKLIPTRIVSHARSRVGGGVCWSGMFSRSEASPKESLFVARGKKVVILGWRNQTTP